MSRLTHVAHWLFNQFIYEIRSFSHLIESSCSTILTHCTIDNAYNCLASIERELQLELVMVSLRTILSSNHKFKQIHRKNEREKVNSIVVSSYTIDAERARETPRSRMNSRCDTERAGGETRLSSRLVNGISPLCLCWSKGRVVRELSARERRQATVLLLRLWNSSNVNMFFLLSISWRSLSVEKRKTRNNKLESTLGRRRERAASSTLCTSERRHGKKSCVAPVRFTHFSTVLVWIECLCCFVRCWWHKNTSKRDNSNVEMANLTCTIALCAVCCLYWIAK